MSLRASAVGKENSFCENSTVEKLIFDIASPTDGKIARDAE